VTLEDLGWNEFLEKAFSACAEKGWQPARLIRDNKIAFGALLGDGEELEVVMSGKVYHDAETDADLPAVGDWVALEIGDENREHIIRARLPRQGTLSRKASGRSTEEQVMAANVEVVVVVTDAGPDFNLRRMERYFAIIGRGHAKSVVMVNKSDLYPEGQNQAAVAAIGSLQPEADVLLTSIPDRRGLTGLKRYLQRGVTITFVGSSGVGKSSVINFLLGDEYQWTDEVNSNTGKGRHTTTARELMVLPRGGILIDNPGIREVHMWTDEATLRERFADIEALAGQCKFEDCTHAHNVSAAACGIQAALQAGHLDPARFEGFLKLEEEITKLRRQRKKRKLTVDRRARRDQRAKSQRYDARRDSGLED
jgi:ribosome biogenesis GTPase / thiamine phosphate phosphatase